MKIIKKEVNNVPVTILKTSKFKSVTATLCFKSPVTKENITKRRMLRNLLMESCNKYDTHEKLYLNSLENYDSYYSSSAGRYGTYIINSFTFASLADKYTKEGNLKNVASTFCEIVFNPLIKNKAFDKETFDIIKKAYKSSLEKIKEDSGSYAEKMAFKNLNQQKQYTFMSEIEYLDEITPSSLYEEYLYMINNSEVELVVSGDIEIEDEIIKMITKNVKNNKKYNEPLIINNDDEKEDFIIKKGKGYGTQNILMVVTYLKNVNHFELNYVAPIYRIILGGASSSRLFSTIREKNSLAYYTFARLEKDDSLMEIIMGIEKENYEKALSLTLKCIDEMKEVSLKEVEEAKKTIVTSLLDSQDGILNLTSREYNAKLFNLPDLDTYIKNLNKVSKADVISFADKVRVGLCYFLEGENLYE